MIVGHYPLDRYNHVYKANSRAQLHSDPSTKKDYCQNVCYKDHRYKSQSKDIGSIVVVLFCPPSAENSRKMRKIKLVPSVTKAAFRERRKILYFSALLLATTLRYSDSVEYHFEKIEYQLGKVSDELWDYKYYKKDWRLGRMSPPKTTKRYR